MIPLSTTTVLVEAASRAEPDGAPTYAAATGPFPAHISAPSGSERMGGEGSERIDAVLLVEHTAEVSAGDRVTDTATGLVYRCSFTTDRQGLGLDHHRCGLVLQRGAVPA